MDSIEKRINSVKFLINRDKLIVPGEKEEDIFKLVSKILLSTKKIKLCSLKSSTYDDELSKTFNNLKFYFNDKDIINRYNDIVIKRHIIHQCLCKGEYSTSFVGPQLAWSLNLPYNLDELSHVFIGHEIIHVLTTHDNYREWKYTLLYSEVISMLYELIQANDKDSKMKKCIINFRLTKLIEMYNIAFTEDVLQTLKNDEIGLKYYQILEKQYFISFYYTVLIYILYKDEPQKILNMIKKVLKQEITTLEMLEQLNIVGDLKSKDFEEGFKLTLK